MSCYSAIYSEQLASKAGLCMMIIFKERAVRLFHLDRHLHSPIFCLPANLFTFLAHFPRLPSFLTCSLAVRNMIRLGPKNKTPTREIAFVVQSHRHTRYIFNTQLGQNAWAE